MRATGFVFISICLHLLCVAAVALTPTRTVTDAGATIEVKVGATAEKAGETKAQDSTAESTAKQVEQATPVAAVAKPEVKTQKAKPAITKAKSAAKQTALPKKQAVVAAAESTPTVEDANAATVAVKEEAAPPQEQEEEKVVLTPVKETAPVGVEAADDSKEEVAPVAAAISKEEPKAESATTSGQAPDKGTLVKGGATQEGAISYLDLRQLPGNKSPNYPLQARVQKRQGQLELLYRVTKEGKVTDMQIAKSSGHKDLDNEALRAIAQFKFVPGQEGWARHPVAFNLKGEMSPLPSRLRSKGGTQAVNE